MSPEEAVSGGKQERHEQAVRGGLPARRGRAGALVSASERHRGRPRAGGRPRGLRGWVKLDRTDPVAVQRARTDSRSERHKLRRGLRKVWRTERVVGCGLSGARPDREVVVRWSPEDGGVIQGRIFGIELGQDVDCLVVPTIWTSKHSQLANPECRYQHEL